MDQLLQAFSEVARFVSGSLASPLDLAAADLCAAGGALILDLGGLVLVRVLGGRTALSEPVGNEYAEAA
ncbi:MAG: hypothetical protein ACREQQ_01245 [Candidatus Binatia bacterium]